MVDSYVCIDLETSGLEPKKDRILEIGAVKVIQGEVTEEYTTLVDAGVHLSPEVVQLTGINEKMLKTGVSVEKAVRECIEFIGDLPLLGHCLLFDFSFLKRAAVNHGRTFEKEGLDTLRIARKTLPELESRGLGSLCSYFQIPIKRRHRALDDARATHILYGKLWERFGEARPELFTTRKLIYQVKKEGPITSAQKRHLKDLLKYHKIELDKEVDTLTKNEASRYIDRIIFERGRPEEGRVPAEAAKARE